MHRGVEGKESCSPTAKNIATTRNLIDRFMRAYQRGTADYQLNFLWTENRSEAPSQPSVIIYSGEALS